MKDVMKNCELLKKEFKCKDDLLVYKEQVVTEETEEIVTGVPVPEIDTHMELDDRLMSISMSSVIW